MFQETRFENGVDNRMEEGKAGCLKTTVMAQIGKKEILNSDIGSKAGKRRRQSYRRYWGDGIYSNQLNIGRNFPPWRE